LGRAYRNREGLEPGSERREDQNGEGRIPEGEEEAGEPVLCDGSGNGQASADWMKLLGKWDETLSNALQLALQRGVHADDLDAETERLYADHVALQRGAARMRPLIQ
jgi:hypothetical protein